MTAQKLVFASKSERLNYYKVKRQWGKDYNLYPNLPFLMVFNTKDLFDLSTWELKRIELTKIEWSRLKKTSIDYTLCDKEDTPLVCIEFDGFQDGFNVGTEYRTEFPSDPWRQEITELKLKIAHNSMFPFFVVGSRHFADFSDDLRLTMVDGIIGEVLAKRAAHDRFAKGFSPKDEGYDQTDFDNLHESEQRDIIQDWALSVEVEADCTHNPITVKCYDLHRELGICKSGTRYVQYPEAPGTENMKARIKALEDATLRGAECIVETPDLGKVKRTCWLPNFKTPYFTGLGLMEEIAQLMAFDWIKHRRDSKSVNSHA
jgi:hypothetical protein